MKDPPKDDYTWGNLVKNYTHFTKGTTLYSIMISQDISPHWVNEPDIISQTTVLSKTWDKDFNCTTCVPSHPVINKWTGLNLSVSDQHFPSMLPPCDDKCLSIARMAIFGLMELAKHTILPIHNQSKKKRLLTHMGHLPCSKRQSLRGSPSPCSTPVEQV